MRPKVISWIILFLFFFSLTGGKIQAQSTSPDDAALANAQAMLKTMTPEEKVGQLFLVTFTGTDVSSTSKIYDLIVNHYIGGVELSAANDNFDSKATIPDAYQLISSLQQDEYFNTANQVVKTDGDTPFIPKYIPLFIGLDQEGDSAPNDQILTGLTNLPNEMAIGATWDTSLAAKVGGVMGSELQALGVNLIMGPSLDVLELNQLTGSNANALGTRSFGGDPFWVGAMGQAYIGGLHQGSSGRLAVITTHFPGSGGADRLPEEEVATVWKSLDQLQQTELVPFIAVTGSSPSPSETADGLLVSNIRYQDFQGIIPTDPVSFDSTALSSLMSLSPFSSWRSNGGLLVSDDLGSQAVRKYEDPTEKTFNAKSVALKAFKAGNDLLYADNFVASGDPDAYTTIVSTLGYFAQQYRADPAFQQRVDDSVLRILTLKYHLYTSFKVFGTVIPSQTGLSQEGQGGQVSIDVADKAVTLISPTAAALNSLLPKPPQMNDRIIFFTDASTAKQCSQNACIPRDTLAKDGLQNSILRLYGPQGAGYVSSTNLQSYSYADLQGFMDGSKDFPKSLQTDLNDASWVIFSTLSPDSTRPETLALQNILSQRPDLLANKKVIVFAFNAPYFLDATNISKLTAYYGVYSKGQNFLDVAARVLFKEITPGGSLPVDVPGVGYEVLLATEPDKSQAIPLSLIVSGQPLPNLQVTTTPNPTVVYPQYKTGDTIKLQAGVILDYNHHPVPDGTVVQFTFTYNGDASSAQQVPALTKGGTATLTYQIDKSGPLQIGITSGEATLSNPPHITLNIPLLATPNLGVTVVITGVPSTTPTRTPIPTYTATPTATEVILRSGKPNLGEWVLAMLSISLGTGLAFLLGFRLLNSLRWGVRWGSSTAVCGLIAYIYLSSGTSSGISWVQQAGTGGILSSTLIGMVVGAGVGLIWWLVERQGIHKNAPITH